MLPGLLLGLGLALAILVPILWLIARGRAEYHATRKVLREISAVPLPEAERRALALLRDSRLFRCAESGCDPRSSGLEGLAGGLRGVLTRYERIETATGPAIRLDRALASSSSRRAGLILVGKGLEATDLEFDLAVRPGEEAVYELYANEPPDPTAGTYRSIFHWVLAVADEVSAARRSSIRRGERSW